MHIPRHLTQSALLSLVVVIGTFTRTQAIDIYADPTTNNSKCQCGTSNNYPTCGTSSKPFKCLGDALKQPNPGDTVIAKNGIYPECPLVYRSGNSGQRITIRAMNSRAATISNPGGTACNGKPTIDVTANFVTLTGFRVDGLPGTTGTNGVTCENSATGPPIVNEFLNLEVYDSRNGIELDSSWNSVRDSLLRNNTNYGIYFVGPDNVLSGGEIRNNSRGIHIQPTAARTHIGDPLGVDIHHNVPYEGIKIEGPDTIVENTHIHHNPGGILESGSAANSLIKKCEIANNGTDIRYSHGLYMGASGSVVSDCKIHHNAAYGIHLYPAPQNFTIERNDIYGNGDLVRPPNPRCSPTGTYPFAVGGGIFVGFAANNVIVRYNRVHHNVAAGVIYGEQCSPAYGGNVFHHNTIYENKGGQIGVGGADPGSVKFLNNIVVNPTFHPASEPDRNVYLVQGNAVSLESNAFDGNLYYSAEGASGTDTPLFNWNNVPLPPPDGPGTTFNQWKLSSWAPDPNCPGGSPSVMDQHSVWASTLVLIDPTMNLWVTGQDGGRPGNYHLMRASQGITGGVCCAASNNGLDIDGETPAACQPTPACDTAGNGIGADYYFDTDGDGTADRYDCSPMSSLDSSICDGDEPASETPCLAAYPGAAYDRDVHQGATEICDGKDDNCSGGSEPDADRDGYFPTSGLCSTSLLDCDDTKPRVYPGASQFCDGINNDCNFGSFVPATEADADHDGWLVCADTTNDCNDSDCCRFPGAPERCNGLDDNCNGISDPAESCSCLAASLCCQNNIDCCSVACTMDHQCM